MSTFYYNDTECLTVGSVIVVSPFETEHYTHYVTIWKKATKRMMKLHSPQSLICGFRVKKLKYPANA